MTQPFEIVSQESGAVATNGTSRIQVLDAAGRIFRRRAIKAVGSGQAQAIEWAVAELDGVRAYFNGTDVILTRADLHP